MLCGVVLISRGYHAGRAGTNDEARELAQRLPGVVHLQNPDRVAAARLAIAQHGSQLLLLDDAFQHRRLHRDLDIVLIDALEPFGYRHLLPRGLLREPLHQLARADLIALSRSDAVGDGTRRRVRDEVLSYAPHATWIELVHRPHSLVNVAGDVRPAAWLQGKPVAAFAGIGNPRGFHHTVQQLGCHVIARRDFPDHHDYDHNDLQSLQQWLAEMKEPPAAVLCTGKDLVKFDAAQLGPCPLWALLIDVEVTVGLQELERHLAAVLNDKP